MASERDRNQPPGRGRGSAQGELAEAEELFKKGYLDEAMVKTASLVEKHPGSPAVQALYGSLLAQGGELEEAARHMEEAVRIEPSSSYVYYNLAQVYLKQSFLAKAAQAARRYLHREPQGQFAAEVRSILAGSEAALVETAAEFGVTATTMERASLLNELAQEAIGRQDYRAAARLARDSARLVRRWTSPRNNQALALFFAGDIAGAKVMEERLLEEIDADNVFAIANLVRINATAGEMAPAEEYLGRLERLLPKGTADLEKMAEAFASLDRDEEVYALLKRAERGEEPLSKEGRRLLAVAAANLGKTEGALEGTEAASGEPGKLRMGEGEQTGAKSRGTTSRMRYFEERKAAREWKRLPS